MKFGTRFAMPRRVTRLEKNESGFCATLDDGSNLCARAVLVATGVEYQRLPIPGLRELEGAGVYYAATEMEAKFCRETEAVAQAKGIALPPGACDAILGYARAMIQDFNSSMARDVEAGRPLEIGSLSGAVVRYGAEAGVPTPANTTFVDALLPLHREAMTRRAQASTR